MNAKQFRRQRWQQLITQQQHSGATVERFCRKHRIGQSTFYAWRKRLQDDPQTAFVELVDSQGFDQSPAETAGPATISTIELRLPCGVMVTLHEQFNPDMLRQIVEALS